MHEPPDRLLEGMIEAQRDRLLQLARRLIPDLTPEDLLQPHNHPALVASPEFNFEDGILAGYLAVRAALRASHAGGMT
jgi:hypothetical protein